MMASQVDRENNAPFLLRLFCKKGSFHRPEEFASRSPPTSINLYAWPSCTLDELALQIAAESPHLLPNPAIGTRLAFRFVFPDPRSLAGGPVDANAGNNGMGGGGGTGRQRPRPNQPNTRYSYQPAPPLPPPIRYVTKELGSVVFGEDGLGNAVATGGEAGSDNGDAHMNDNDDEEPPSSPPLATGPHGGGSSSSAGQTTLEDARFIIGDYVSCAILPPLTDGDVAPESHAWGTPGGAGPVPGGAVLGSSRSHPSGFVGLGRDDKSRRRPPVGGDVPEGEWRRGERLPDEPPHEPRWFEQPRGMRGRGGARGRR